MAIRLLRDWLRANSGKKVAKSAEAVVALPPLPVAQVSPSEARQAVIQFQQGMAHLSKSQPDAAEHHLRQAIALNPWLAEAYANLGSLLRDHGFTQEAELHLRRAVDLMPELAAAWFTLAMSHIDQAQWGEAVRCMRQAVKREARDAEAQYWLGYALMGIGDRIGARRACRTAIQLQHDHARARWAYVMSRLPAIPQDQQEQDKAALAWAQELEELHHWFERNPAAPGHEAVASQQPYYLAYIAGNHRDILARYGGLCADLMARWQRQAGMPAPANRSGAKGKYRLGIVSAYLHSHSVWFALVRGWIEHLDPARFEIHLFHTGRRRDAETDWAVAQGARLHQDTRLTGVEWAKRLAQSGMDVLIYPEIGMDGRSMQLASLRLARIQLASWGHPLTSGLPTIDAFISADALEPPQAAAHYTERLVRLPRLGCCYRPFGTQAAQVDFSAYGIHPGDRVLLCAGTSQKYAPEHDKLWVEIARRCRPCRLVFFRLQNQELSILLEQRLNAAFQAAGLAPNDYMTWVPWRPHAEFFSWLDRADVYLDTIGFSGFNTVMQAVERGTPIVAYEGEYMRGRFASAILRQLGLDEWVAASPEAYVALVEKLLADESASRDIRVQMAQGREGLYHDAATVRALEQELLAMAGG